MTQIGELVVSIKADAAQLQSEMQKTTAIVKDSSSQMGSSLESVKEQFKELVPAITAAAVVEFAKGALEAADSLYILSQRTGIAIDTLSALNIPLKQNGSNVEEFASSMKFLSRNIQLAAEGNVELLKRFDDLHLSVTKLLKLTPDEQMLAWAKALGGVTDQSKLMADAMATGGRGVAGLIPIIKETKGNLQEFIDKQKELGTLTPDEVKKVHEFDDAIVSLWEHAKVGIVDYLYYFEQLGEAHRKAIDDMTLPHVGFGASVSFTRPDVPSDQDLSKKLTDSLRAKGLLPEQDKDAQGNNQDILAANDALKQQAQDYDQLTGTLDEYINKLDQQHDALQLGKVDGAGMKAVYEAEAIAMKNGDLLTQEQIDHIKETAEANEKLKQTMDDNTKVARHMTEALSDGLADAITNFHNLRDAATSAIQDIAKEIIKAEITNPLAASIMGALPSFGSLFGGFFADGGTLSPGQWGIAGENGPEPIYAGKTGMTVIPNKASGGAPSVTVIQNNSFGSGVTRQEVASLLPVMAQMSKQAVLAEFQKGGDASKLIGKRS